MSNFKVSIKIEWDGMGVRENADMWINYFPGNDGVDERILEWFRATYAKAYEKYASDQDKAMISAEEAAERAEYERLRAKFG